MQACQTFMDIIEMKNNECFPHNFIILKSFSNNASKVNTNIENIYKLGKNNIWKILQS